MNQTRRTSKEAAVIAALLLSSPIYTRWGFAQRDDVNSRECAKCHRQIAENYARTGMGRSFVRPSPANTLEAYSTENDASKRDIYHAPSDTHYSMVIRDGRYYQRRWQTGFGGGETNIEEMRIDYVLGSGNHARSYLHRTARGTLIELPLGWYAESRSEGLGRSGAGHWGMSPGSDSIHPRTRRFVSYKCMFCHNGIPQIPEGYESPDSDPVFTGDLPEGIDCQRCHGSGGRHLQAVANPNSNPRDIRESIVNPARLDPARRMEVCMQCHLETTSGRIPATLIRFNRGPFSYVPGEPLDAFLLTFDHAQGTGHDDKFEAVSSVYRLRKSKCFLQSEGRLTCDTCHDPHRVTHGAEAAARYSKVCRSCHSVATLTASKGHVQGADCTNCHMPKRRAEDTPGMIMTDHLIQRRPPSGDLLAMIPERPAENYKGEIVPYYPSPLPRTPENALYAAVAQVGLDNNAESGLRVLAHEISRQNPKEAEFYRVLGEAWLKAGKARNAIAAAEEATKRNPVSQAALRLLADALSVDGQASRVAEVLKRAVQIAPSDPITWYRYGMFDLAGGRAPEAVEKIRRAIALDPALPDLSRTLAEALLKIGEPEAAQSATREALRTDPYDAAAWDLSGRLLSERGNLPEAFYNFERAVRLGPENGTYRYDFALALVRGDRFQDAQSQAEAAVRVEPNLADAHELLGGLFARKRQLSDAAREYRRAVDLRPDSGRAHLRLANVLAAQGDGAGAIEHWRMAAKDNDTMIAQQAAQALRQVGVH